MMRFLGTDLWKTITAYAQRSKTRRIAVAYLGKGANELLPLKKGDTLIVNMTLPNVKNSQVNPFEVEKYYNAGVKIFHCKNLHSKVYLFDKQAIICSANISNNSYSSTGLIECGVLTTNKQVLHDTATFINRLAVEKVSRAYIDLCKENYNPPKFTGAKGKQLIKEPQIETSNFWVIYTEAATLSEEEQKILENDKEAYEEELINKDDYEVDSIRYGASSSFIKGVKKGDWVMPIWNTEHRAQVQEPKRVLGITKGRRVNSKGHRNVFLRIEERIIQQKQSWTAFERYMKKNKITGIRKTTTKQINNEETKHKLYKFWKE